LNSSAFDLKQLELVKPISTIFDPVKDMEKYQNNLTVDMSYALFNLGFGDNYSSISSPSFISTQKNQLASESQVKPAQPLDAKTSVKCDAMLQILCQQASLRPTYPGLVSNYLSAAGINSGYASWCASFITYGCKGANIPIPPNPAAVISWMEWAGQKGILTTNITTVKKGDLGFWIDPGTQHGHIFAINSVSVNENGVYVVNTVEGNTSPPTGAPSTDLDRSGHSAYLKVRKVMPNFQFIRLTSL